MPNTTVPFYFLFAVCPNFPLTSFDKKKTKFKRNLRQERVRNEKMHNVIQNFQEIFIIWTWLLCLFCNLSEVESHSKRHLSFSTFATNLVFFFSLFGGNFSEVANQSQRHLNKKDIERINLSSVYSENSRFFGRDLSFMIKF